MDEVLNKTGHLRLLIDKENDNKLEWRLSYGEGIYINATKAEIEARKKVFCAHRNDFVQSK
jgi:hypothetical protein